MDPEPTSMVPTIPSPAANTAVEHKPNAAVTANATTPRRHDLLNVLKVVLPGCHEGSRKLDGSALWFANAQQARPIGRPDLSEAILTRVKFGGQ